MEIRRATLDDAAAWTRVRRDAVPYVVTSEESSRQILTSDRRLDAAVALDDEGDVVGISRVSPPGPDGDSFLTLVVAPAARRRGIGSALLAWARGVADGPFVGIAEAGGFPAVDAWGARTMRELSMALVDPRTVGEVRVLADGHRLVPVEDVGAAAVWACYSGSAADDPSGLSGADSFEDFLSGTWDVPVHRPDLGRAVVTADGEVAATALVDVADDRAWNSYTGTHPEHRGLGLATAVKTASLRALAAAGVTRCGTGNDAANAAMRAVNRRLGYEPLPPARLVRLDG